MRCYNGRIDYKSNLVFFYDLKDGVPFVRQLNAEWLSWHLEPIEGIFKKYIRYQQREGSYWVVSWKTKTDREQCCRALGSKALEADVNPITNILRRADEIEITRPRRGYWDIETNDEKSFEETLSGGSEILCISLQIESGEVFSFLLEERTDEAEKRLIDAFLEKVSEHVDQLVGWNTDRFDEPVLRERARMLGCNTRVLQRILFMDQMQCYLKHNLNNADSGEEKQSVALNNVAFALLGEGKKDLENKGILELYNEDPKRLLEYNVQDVALMPKIEEKTGYLELQFAVCQLCRIFPNSYSLNATKFIDAFMLRLGIEMDHHWPTKWHDSEMSADKFLGAFVLKPTELGIHREVHTFDFSSLYPSAFKTWNLSPEVRRSKDKHEGWAYCPGTELYFDQSKKGMFPIAFERLQQIRKKWQKIEEEAIPDSPEEKYAAKMSMGCKVVVNSAYGVATSPFTRYLDKEVGASCTQNGAWLTKSVMQYLRDKGMNVLTGDTDAQQFKGCSIEEAKVFVSDLNDRFLPELIKECGCKENHVKLEYEKTFDFVVYSTDGKGSSVAKKYIGQYCIFRGKPVVNGKPKIRGLEYRRGDSIKLARDLQYQIFTMLCEHKFDSMPYEELIMRWRKRIMEEPLEADDIVMSKSLRMSLKEYKSNSAHIRLAKEMEEEGDDVGEGTRIRFYIKDGTKSPKEVKLISEYENDADRFYLWERIYEPSLRVLAGAFPKFPWHKMRSKRPKQILAGQLAFW